MRTIFSFHHGHTPLLRDDGILVVEIYNERSHHPDLGAEDVAGLQTMLRVRRHFAGDIVPAQLYGWRLVRLGSIVATGITDTHGFSKLPALEVGPYEIIVSP